MKIRDTPIVRGLNRHKIGLGLAGLMLLIISIISYIALHSQSADSSQSEVTQTNYAKPNTGTADVNAIAGSGRGKGAVSSSPARASSSASSPQSSNQGQQNNQALAQQQQAAAQEVRAAMRAPITALTPQGGGSASGSNSRASAPVSQADSGLLKDDQNMTAEKRQWARENSGVSDDTLSTGVTAPVSALELVWGTKIPAMLDSQINSDLPGLIYGHVTRDVYDSRTHSKILIPAGANLVGTYDSALAYGQERLFVSWKRINFPNDEHLDIQGMPGSDSVGAGLGDQVNNHYWRIFGATFLTSVLAAGAQLSQPQQSNALQAPSAGQTIGQSVGTQIAQTGTQLMQKNINIQPTLEIRAGFEFTIDVNKDIPFTRAYTANSRKNQI